MLPLETLPADRVLKETTSRCPVCRRPVRAEVVERNGRVDMVKACAEHGRFEVTLARDRRFYHLACGAREGSSCCGAPAAGAPQRTPGADPFERLSTCVALIEIVDSCNLACPTCYADSPSGAGDQTRFLALEECVRRVEAVIARKGALDILQLSGGEPTLHPDFFALLEWALATREIGYVLVNTNGVRLAQEERFRERLGALRRRHGRLELYLQFDGPQRAGQLELRGADLRHLRARAIDGAGEVGVPSTLAMVVNQATIAHLGAALRFALERPHCRGLTFQPEFSSGRTPAGGEEPSRTVARVSVGDVILALVEQARDVVTVEDFTPLPCGDPNCHTIAYLLRRADGGVIGLSRLLDLGALQGFLGERVNYDLGDLERCGCETEPLGELLRRVELGPESPFRVFIKPFMDAWTFDQDRIDRCCTHVILADGRLDSFCRHYLERGAAAARPGPPPE